MTSLYPITAGSSFRAGQEFPAFVPITPLVPQHTEDKQSCSLGYVPCWVPILQSFTGPPPWNSESLVGTVWWTPAYPSLKMQFGPIAEPQGSPALGQSSSWGSYPLGSSLCAGISLRSWRGGRRGRGHSSAGLWWSSNKHTQPPCKAPVTAPTGCRDDPLSLTNQYCIDLSERTI
jgi:hypothetical protein